LAAADVVAALQTQNVQVAAGSIGSAPMRADQPYHVSVRAIGRLRTAEEFGNLILRSNPDAGFVRLRDVGRVELGAESYAVDLRVSGSDAIGIAVLTLPSANGIVWWKPVAAITRSNCSRDPSTNSMYSPS
jgi:multidrug efflux pump subunit AcrB